MKSLMLSLIAVCSLTVIAEENKPGPDGVIRNPDGTVKMVSKEEYMKLSPEQKKRQVEAIKLSKVGPMIEKPNVVKGYFKYICCTDKINANDLEKTVNSIVMVSRVRLEVAKGKTPDLNNAKASLKECAADAGVFIVEMENMPRIMLAPEDGWAIVNVTALSADNPNRETLVKRVNIELIRAFSYICGSASDQRSVVMGPIADLKDLDAIPSATFVPFNLQNIVKSLANFGIVPRAVASYRAACKQGWAYQPTNEIERAIWNEVHNERERGPVNGLKIAPPKK